ncbi:hypothetical protein B2A_06451, partial [mine drainage metagenome]
TFNLFRMRQSSRRSWRIGQTFPVRVRHIFYRDTYQEEAITHMGHKLYVSLALEGRFGGSALLEMAESKVQDGTKLARQIAGSLSGEDVWDKLRRKKAEIEALTRMQNPTTTAPQVSFEPTPSVVVAVESRPVDFVIPTSGKAEQLDLFG